MGVRATIARSMFFAMAVLPGTAIAQNARTITLRVDNDAFNFWKTPGDRPDEEYTSGVHLRYDGGGAPWWGRSFARSLSSCTPGANACRARAFEFGQSIYTPRRTNDRVKPPLGSRPNAAWLHIDESARLLRESRADEFTVTLGVTGDPALGEFTQRIAHSFAPSFNRPTDWSEQVEFEPGVILGYEHTRRVRLGSAMEILPRARVELGNVSTAVQAGARLRTGIHLQHPWLPLAADAPLEIALAVGGSARGVARDLFLDGNTFGSGPRVGHEPFSTAFDWSLTLRRRWLVLSYGSVSEGRTYEGGPRWHAWSAMTLAVSK